MKIELINGSDDSIIEFYDPDTIESAHYLVLMHIGDSVITISGEHGIIIYKELDIFRKVLRIILSLINNKIENKTNELPQQRNGE